MLQKSLRINHKPDNQKPTDVLPRIENLLNEMAEAEDWPASLTFKTNLILEELVLNTLTHGDLAGLTGIDIELHFQDNVLEVKIADDGAEFNPLQDAPIPDTTLSLNERTVGGLGVFLVQTMSKNLEYQREGQYNRLTFVVHPES